MTLYHNLFTFIFKLKIIFVIRYAQMFNILYYYFYIKLIFLFKDNKIKQQNMQKFLKYKNQIIKLKDGSDLKFVKEIN